MKDVKIHPLSDVQSDQIGAGTRIWQFCVVLDDIIRTITTGYDTGFSERGIRFSGGQRQRIRMARTLNKTADVLTLDEATNSQALGTEVRLLNRAAKQKNEITPLTISHGEQCFKTFNAMIDIPEHSGRLHGGNEVQGASNDKE